MTPSLPGTPVSSFAVSGVTFASWAGGAPVERQIMPTRSACPAVGYRIARSSFPAGTSRRPGIRSAPGQLLPQPRRHDQLVPRLKVDRVHRDLVEVAALVRALLHIDVRVALRERDPHG